MANHRHVIEGGHAHCNICGAVPTQAPMSKPIYVGFGEATVRRDGVVVIDGEKEWESDKPPTFLDAEGLASADPDHDWTVVLNGPLHGETYQRQGPGVWLLVEKNNGFA